MDWLYLLISFISGIFGGNVAGEAITDRGLGPFFNTITGLVGGGLSFYFLQLMGLFDHIDNGLEYDVIFSAIGGGLVGGAGITVIFGLMKSFLKL